MDTGRPKARCASGEGGNPLPPQGYVGSLTTAQSGQGYPVRFQPDQVEEGAPLVDLLRKLPRAPSAIVSSGDEGVAVGLRSEIAWAKGLH